MRWGPAAGVLLWLILFGGEALRSALSWWGFGPLAGAVAILCGIAVWRRRHEVAAALRRPAGLLLIAFVALCALSVLWSFYRTSTLIGLVALVATLLAGLVLLTRLDHGQRMGTLLIALHILVVLSLAFEVFVGTAVRHPITPGFSGYGDRRIPDALYWSRAELFEGGRIQGIVGNANILGFLALLGLVLAIAALTRAGSTRMRVVIGALIVADVIALALTRSSTVLVATLAVAVVATALGIARRRGRRGRHVVAAAMAGLAVATGVTLVVARERMLGRLGRSPDLTGRLDIWESVGGLVAERPVLGWGWVSYWTPWTPPFDDLAIRNGVRYLQAHNAFLDVVFQTGVVGLALFVGLVVVTVVVVVRRALAPGGPAGPALLPALLVTALLAQSLAESRLILEGNLILLIVLALGAGAHDPSPPELGADSGSPIMRTLR